MEYISIAVVILWLVAKFKNMFSRLQEESFINDFERKQKDTNA